jgi:ribonuclease HI
MAEQDTGWFDGSCEKNPGGRMGAGWHLLFADGREERGSQAWEPTPGNTNNVGEYQGLLHLLHAYLLAGGQGPLQVYGDSQLVINQMNEVWGVNTAALWRLKEQAEALCRHIPGGVRFAWIPREQNQVADSLAGGESGTPVGAAIYAETPPNGIPDALAEQITRLNRSGHGSFKEFLALRVGGRDACSELSLQELRRRVGAPGNTAIGQAFPEAIKDQEAALRWMLRGLAAHLAIRKVQVDLEMRANKEKVRGRAW